MFLLDDILSEVSCLMEDGVSRKLHGVYSQAEKQGLVFRR